jgi:hypothetical protein
LIKKNKPHMARVEYGAIITDIRGSIGGITFYTNRAGKVARLRSGTRKTQTSWQAGSQSDLMKTLNEWQGLTLPQQVVWDTYALAHTKDDRYGDTKYLSGFNWFGSINRFRWSFGLATLTAPPSYASPVAVPAYTLNISETAMEVDFAASWSAPNVGLALYTTPPLLRATSSVRSNFRLTKIYQPATFDIIDFTNDWEIRHGITWPTTQDASHVHIYSMLLAIDTTNCITGIGSIMAGEQQAGNEGIGYWIIQTNFVVS